MAIVLESIPPERSTAFFPRVEVASEKTASNVSDKASAASLMEENEQQSSCGFFFIKTPAAVERIVLFLGRR